MRFLRLGLVSSRIWGRHHEGRHHDGSLCCHLGVDDASVARPLVVGSSLSQGSSQGQPVSCHVSEHQGSSAAHVSGSMQVSQARGKRRHEEGTNKRSLFCSSPLFKSGQENRMGSVWELGLEYSWNRCQWAAKGFFITQTICRGLCGESGRQQRRGPGQWSTRKTPLALSAGVLGAGEPSRASFRKAEEKKESTCARALPQEPRGVSALDEKEAKETPFLFISPK